MASQNNSMFSQKGKSNEAIFPLEKWKLPDNLDSSVSFATIVTRSQTAFQRIENSEFDMQFFSSPSYYKPELKPHIMEILKGPYGNIQRTMVTRSTASHLKRSEPLCDTIKEYKKLGKKADAEKAKQKSESLEQVAEMAKQDEDKLKAETDAKKETVEKTEDEDELKAQTHAKEETVEKNENENKPEVLEIV